MSFFEIRNGAIVPLDLTVRSELPRWLVRAKGGGVVSGSNDHVVGGDVFSRETGGVRWSRHLEGSKQSSGFIEGTFEGDLSGCSTDSGGVVASWTRVPRPKYEAMEGGTGTRGRPADEDANKLDVRSPTPIALAFSRNGEWSRKALQASLAPYREHDFDLDCVGNLAKVTTVVRRDPPEFAQLSCGPRGCTTRCASLHRRASCELISPQSAGPRALLRSQQVLPAEEPRFIEFRTLGERSVLLWIARGALRLRMASFADLLDAREYELITGEGQDLSSGLYVNTVRAPNAFYVLFKQDGDWRGLAISESGRVVPVTLEGG